MELAGASLVRVISRDENYLFTGYLRGRGRRGPCLGRHALGATAPAPRGGQDAGPRLPKWCFALPGSAPDGGERGRPLPHSRGRWGKSRRGEMFLRPNEPARRPVHPLTSRRQRQRRGVSSHSRGPEGALPNQGPNEKPALPSETRARAKAFGRG